jgi:tetratricopeptide (TPR) repeat protein
MEEAEEPQPSDNTKKGDRLSALRVQIGEAKDKSERARLQRTLVDYLVALNRKSDAITELRAMALDDRIDPVGFYNIGNALARLGDTETAIEAYRKAVDQRHGNYARALNNLGVVLMRGKRWTEAREALSSALRQEDFRYGEASYNLGRLHAALGETKLAIKEWTRTLRLQPDHLDAALALARAHAASGSPERGIAVIDAFVERHGPNARLIEARNEIISGRERMKIGTAGAGTDGEAGARTAAPVQPS